MFRTKTFAAFFTGLSLVLLLAYPTYAASYTVAQNDSLYQIGKLFNTSADSLAQSNRLSSSVIYPGQVLNVPCSTYTVKSGDSLFLVASKFGVSLDALRKANNKWDNSIYPGQVLNLPGGASSTNSTASASSSRGSGVAYNASDTDLLARLITAEADGQPYSAMVGVGAVVLNRVKDSRFPNSISAVIYQKSDGFYQFTPVENGWINKPASENAKKAASDALNGSDPTKGAVFYFDDSATNKWLWSKPIAARIGRMVFTY